MAFSDNYKKNIRPALQKELGLKNVHEIPSLYAIVLNIGMGKILKDRKDYSQIEKNLAAITGQKPVVRLSKKSISNFKLRKGMPVGLKVTLRGKIMYDFFEKLVSSVLPRIRDFKGMSEKSFDQDGHYHFGLKEIGIFPDINPDDLKENHGVQISLLFKTKNPKYNLALLRGFSFPFIKN